MTRPPAGRNPARQERESVSGLPDAAAYTVADAGGCTCPAGARGRPCKHAAAAAKLVERKVLAAR